MSKRYLTNEEIELLFINIKDLLPSYLDIELREHGIEPKDSKHSQCRQDKGPGATSQFG